jgi:hypothetical protein
MRSIPAWGWVLIERFPACCFGSGRHHLGAKNGFVQFLLGAVFFFQFQPIDIQWLWWFGKKLLCDGLHSGL